MGIYQNTILFYGFRARQTPKLFRLFGNNPSIEIVKIDNESSLVMVVNKQIFKETFDYSRTNNNYFTKEEMIIKMNIDKSFFDLNDNLISIFTKENIKAQWIIAEIMSTTLDGPNEIPTLLKIVPIF
jgi:hypothetical protein